MILLILIKNLVRFIFYLNNNNNIDWEFSLGNTSKNDTNTNNNNKNIKEKEVLPIVEDKNIKIAKILLLKILK